MSDVGVAGITVFGMVAVSLINFLSTKWVVANENKRLRQQLFQSPSFSRPGSGSSWYATPCPS